MIFLKENRIPTFRCWKFPQIYSSGKAIKWITTCYARILFHKPRTFGVETIPTVSQCFLTAISVLLKDKLRPQQFQGTHFFLSPNHTDSPRFRALQKSQTVLTAFQALPWARLNFLNCSKEKYATAGKSLISNWFVGMFLFAPCTETKQLHLRTVEIFGWFISF